MATNHDQSVDARVEELLRVLQQSAELDYIGEPISQLEHALQCAFFAQRAGADRSLILGALLHDIGHLIDDEAPTMDALGVVDHEHLGASYLASLGFSNEVTTVVANHVEAKRYLCWRSETYFERLSDASRGTLRWQGGPMTERQASLFESGPHFKAILAVRQWDEMGKDPELVVPDLSHYEPMIRKHLSLEEVC